MGYRKGELIDMKPKGERMHLEFLIPTRGLFGYKTEFLTDTKGEGVMNTVFDSYQPEKGEITKRFTARSSRMRTERPPATVSSIRRTAARCSSSRP